VSAFLRLCLLLLCVNFVHAQENARGSVSSDFAWGVDLNLLIESAFYRLKVPLEVYQGVRLKDLGDIRVFNGEGLVVPHELVLPPLLQEQQQGRQSAKLFPLYGTRTTSIQTLSVHLKQRTKDGQLSLSSRERVPRKGEVLQGYLIQLWEPDQQRGTQSLQLDWKVPRQGFVHRLKIELSDDLEHWVVHDQSSVVADLRSNGERLLKNTVSLGSTKRRYARLTPVANSEPIELTAAWLFPNSRTMATEPQRWIVDTVQQGDEPGTFQFELPGPLPGAWLKVVPHSQNTFLKAKLYSRDNPEASWRLRSSGRIYNLLSEGAQLKKTRLNLNQEADQYWKLSAGKSGGGFGVSPPQLEWAWIPHTLLFAARGEAPFKLAYGSGKVIGASKAGLDGFAKDLDRSLVSEQVRLGAPHELGGQKALASIPELDWKQLLLWGVLILFTLLLGGLAWSTVRQMQRGVGKSE